jgi:hypothetical protein
VLGAERFEECATQVGRRVDLGVPLIRETIDRVSATRTTPFTRAEGESSDTGSMVYEPDVQASSKVDDASLPIAAIREDAATLAFEAIRAALFTDAGTCRGNEDGEGAVLSGRSAPPTWLTAARQVAKDQVENRSLILRVFLPFVFGYYIAYLFRTINAVMAVPLATELGLGADDLGLLTSVYLLTFAAARRTAVFTMKKTATGLTAEKRTNCCVFRPIFYKTLKRLLERLSSSSIERDVEWPVVHYDS